jgi:hypothetical protein
MLIASRVAAAQAISTTGIERDARSASSWRLAYDNDFFTATDRYFTQGIVIEVVTPALARSPLRRVLIAPRTSWTRYGVAYEDDGYTASDLKASQILTRDHPYAGTKQLRMFDIAIDTLRHRRVTSALNIGLIGQGAGGAEIQTFIHERTGNTIPQGWHNQIRNDLIVNYEAAVEHEALRIGRWVLVTGTATARFGTYNTAATAGAAVLVGRVGDPYRERQPGRALYAYVKPQVNLVGYDATLQGGLFNRSSPYTIATGDLSRVVYRQQLGLVFRSGHLYAEYYQSLGTREFQSGRAHKSGGMQIGILSRP